jgi:hypothetical protein
MIAQLKDRFGCNFRRGRCEMDFRHSRWRSAFSGNGYPACSFSNCSCVSTLVENRLFILSVLSAGPEPTSCLSDVINPSSPERPPEDISTFVSRLFSCLVVSREMAVLSPLGQISVSFTSGKPPEMMIGGTASR